MNRDIQALADLDEAAATAEAIAAGAELGQLLILQLEEGSGAVWTALAELPPVGLFKMLVCAIATLARPDVVAAIAKEGT